MDTTRCNCRWILLTIFNVIVSQNALAVQSVEWDKSEAVPCSGLQNELIRHRDVAVCRGSWTGNIATKATHICTNGWHVCTWKNSRALSQISWYEATHISGCYVINASHDGAKCSPCLRKSETAEMAAVGADCLTYDESSRSCFGKGRIDASHSGVPQYTPCHHAPWITGVLCCRNGTERSKVNVVTDISPSNDVMQGTRLVLRCQATATNSVQYTWYRDGHLVRSLYDNGTMVIESVSVDDAGLWRCIAVHSRGTTLSPHSITLRVREWSGNRAASGCRNPRTGEMLASSDGNIALCNGSWKGHVRTASKSLCARGWKICSNKNRLTLYSAMWQEMSNVNGCYAYNAASTKYYPCKRCSPKHADNRMSGIGRGCGVLKDAGYSCLSRGRIDIHAAAFASVTAKRKRTQRTCRYTEGLTTGVACCRRTRSKTTKSRKVKTACKCKNHGTCSRHGSCKCRPGYKGKRCQHRIRGH